MVRRSRTARVLAIAMALIVPLVALPARAQSAEVKGTVYSSGSENPLGGVKVYAAHVESGRMLA